MHSMLSEMQTYTTFQKSFQLENYLIDLPNELHKALAMFRISAHRLEIEKRQVQRNTCGKKILYPLSR